MIVGLIGGTGSEGRGLALRFAQAGLTVVLGSRSAEKAAETAASYNAILQTEQVRGARNQDVIEACEVLFLTVPSDRAGEIAAALSPDLKPGRILVDVTVPLRFQKGRADYREPPEGSNSEHIAALIQPGIAVVGAFKTVPAHVLADLATPLECDVFVCGDEPAAKRRVMEVAGAIPGLRPLDAGPLSAARTLERMTALAVSFNRHYGSKGARYRIVGI